MSNPHEVITVKCAHCGKFREQTNHWFTVWMGDARPRKHGEFGPAFGCWPLDISMPLQEDELPACGQACAQKLFERWMDEVRNAEATKPNTEKAGAPTKEEAVVVPGEETGPDV